MDCPRIVNALRPFRTARQDLQDLPAPQVSPVNPVDLVNPEMTAPQAKPQLHARHKMSPANRAPPDLPDQQDRTDNLAHPDPMVNPALPANQADKAHLDQQDLPEIPAPAVNPVAPDSQDNPVKTALARFPLPDRKDLQVAPVPLDLPDQMETLANPADKDLPDHPGRQEIPDLPAAMVNPASPEARDCQVRMRLTARALLAPPSSCTANRWLPSLFSLLLLFAKTTKED